MAVVSTVASGSFAAGAGSFTGPDKSPKAARNKSNSASMKMHILSRLAADGPPTIVTSRIMYNSTFLRSEITTGSYPFIYKANGIGVVTTLDQVQFITACM